MPGESMPVGRPETDAARKLRWLHRQVAPVVQRLLGMYPERDLYAVIFGGLDPTGLVPLDRRGEDDLAAYDEWSIDNKLAR